MSNIMSGILICFIFFAILFFAMIITDALIDDYNINLILAFIVTFIIIAISFFVYGMLKVVN